MVVVTSVVGVVVCPWWWARADGYRVGTGTRWAGADDGGAVSGESSIKRPPSGWHMPWATWEKKGMRFLLKREPSDFCSKLTFRYLSEANLQICVQS